MKVIGLIASPRGKNSNTRHLVEKVLEGAKKEGAIPELVDIYSLHIENCTACNACHTTGECPQLDDFSDLFDRIMNSEGIVLGAPNYIDSVPGPLKTVFDRMSGAIHCQMLTGKFGCSVCTSGGSGTDEVVGYMNKVLLTLGANVVGGIGVASGTSPGALGKAEADAHDLGRKLVRSIRSEISYPEQDLIHQEKRNYFCQLVKSDKDGFAYEYDWYVRNGWMK
ncbi:MAG: flavodoxin family protein [Methanoregula sp.]